MKQTTHFFVDEPLVPYVQDFLKTIDNGQIEGLRLLDRDTMRLFYSEGKERIIKCTLLPYSEGK